MGDADSDDAAPATSSPDGLGRFPVPPPRALEEPCECCTHHLYGFLWGFFCGLGSFIQPQVWGGDSDPTLAPLGVTAPLKHHDNIPQVSSLTVLIETANRSQMFRKSHQAPEIRIFILLR